MPPEKDNYALSIWRQEVAADLAGSDRFVSCCRISASAAAGLLCDWRRAVYPPRPAEPLEESIQRRGFVCSGCGGIARGADWERGEGYAGRRLRKGVEDARRADG